MIEQRAREIANEAMERIDQGETEESAARYVHEDITAHTEAGRWLLRVLRDQIIKILVRESAPEVCELIGNLLSSIPF